MSKRKASSGYRNGSIDERSPGRYRLRYWINGKKYSCTVQANNRTEAKQQLQGILGNRDSHIAPNKITLEAWIDEWLALIKRTPAGAARRRGIVNPRTIERYGQLLDHAKAELGKTKLQKLTVAMIDTMYMKLEQTLAPRTVLHLHNALRPCLAKAVDNEHMKKNPADKATAPKTDDVDIRVLDEVELAELVRGFRGHPLEMIVDIAAHTGMRRNEVIGLQWGDIDTEKCTIRVMRSVEDTIEHGRHLKAPKTARGKRTIAIDAGLAQRLAALRDRAARLAAGIPDGAEVDLSLIRKRVKADAMVFPGETTPLRDGHAVSRVFKANAEKLGYPVKLHWVRAAHLTILLDAGQPVHAVAARAGHDPVTLLRSYAKWTKKTDAKIAETIAGFSARSV